MLDVAVNFLTRELNAYLMTRTGANFGDVQISRIVDDSGKWAIQEDHIGAAILNVEEERVLRSQLPEPSYINGQYVMLEPELKLNLHVLFAAYFKRYDQALKFLSHLLTFFQAH